MACSGTSVEKHVVIVIPGWRPWCRKSFLMILFLLLVLASGWRAIIRRRRRWCHVTVVIFYFYAVPCSTSGNCVVQDLRRGSCRKAPSCMWGSVRPHCGGRCDAALPAL